MFYTNRRKIESGARMLRAPGMEIIDRPPPAPEILYNLFKQEARQAGDPFGPTPALAQEEDGFETVLFSDLHVGGAGSLIDDALAFLRQERPTYALIVGDLYDNNAAWYHDRTRDSLRAASPDTKYVYIPGNHDEIFRHNPLLIRQAETDDHFIIRQEVVLPMPDGTQALVLHGDIFDPTVKSRVATIVGTYTNLVLNKGDHCIGKVSSILGYPNVTPIFNRLRRIEKWTCPLVENNAFAYVGMLNNDIGAWNIANPGQEIPFYSSIFCGHTHHAGMSTRSVDPKHAFPLGPKEIIYRNLGCWVGPARREVGNNAWRDQLIYPVDTFFGIKRNGEFGSYLYDPDFRILDLEDRADNGHFLNPLAARDNAQNRARPGPDRQRKFG